MRFYSRSLMIYVLVDSMVLLACASVALVKFWPGGVVLALFLVGISARLIYAVFRGGVTIREPFLYSRGLLLEGSVLLADINEMHIRTNSANVWPRGWLVLNTSKTVRLRCVTFRHTHSVRQRSIEACSMCSRDLAQLRSIARDIHCRIIQD